MATIWKQLVFARQTSVKFPQGSKILSAHAQKGTVAIWAIVYNTDAPVKEFPISVYATGQEMTGFEVFVDTVHLGTLVFHVFCHPGDKA